jgi:hypothetical protein
VLTTVPFGTIELEVMVEFGMGREDEAVEI